MKESNEQRAKALLTAHRIKIDALDAEILRLLGERFKVVHQVGKIKKKHGIPSYLPDRVAEVRDGAVKLGKKYGIDPQFTHALYSSIIYHACGLEDAIRKKK